MFLVLRSPELQARAVAARDSAVAIAIYLTQGGSQRLAGWPNFTGLVLCCIEADFCNQIVIFQHFSRSTRLSRLCTSRNSKSQQIFVKYSNVSVRPRGEAHGPAQTCLFPHVAAFLGGRAKTDIKCLSLYFCIFHRFSVKNHYFSMIFIEFRTDFDEFFSEFR